MPVPLALDVAPAGQAEGWRRHEDIIDALPYVDTLSAEEKARVDVLIKEEMKRSDRTVAEYLRELQPMPKLSFELMTAQRHPVLQAELARVRAGVAMDAMDVTRYQLDPPPLERKNDVSAWRRALDNAHSQLEHQYNRVMNLELLLKFGPQAWKVHNASLEAHNSRLEKEATELQARIDFINRERKLQQTAVGADLADLEAEWQSLIGKNREIDAACAGMEAELSRMQQSAPGGDAAPMLNGRSGENAADSSGDSVSTTNMSHA